jgi:hypothetical protein
MEKGGRSAKLSSTNVVFDIITDTIAEGPFPSVMRTNRWPKTKKSLFLD